MKITKLTLITIIIIALLAESTGTGYALRPMAEANSNSSRLLSSDQIFDSNTLGAAEMPKEQDKSYLPQIPESIGRDEAKRLCLEHYYSLFSEGIERYKEAHNGNPPLSYRQLAIFLKMRDNVLGYWIEEIKKSVLFPKLEIISARDRRAQAKIYLPQIPIGTSRKEARKLHLQHYYYLFKSGIAEYKKAHSGNPPLSCQKLITFMDIPYGLFWRWFKRIEESKLFPKLEIVSQRNTTAQLKRRAQILLGAVEEYRKTHGGRLPRYIKDLAVILKRKESTLRYWLKGINESKEIPNIRLASLDDWNALWVSLIKDAIERYKLQHNGKLPTEQEIADDLGVTRMQVNWRISSNPSAGIKTRGPFSKNKRKYVSDEEFIDAYFDFIRRTDKLPTMKNLAKRLNIPLGTIGQKLRIINKKRQKENQPLILTRGMGIKRQARFVTDEEFLSAFNRYVKMHNGALPSLSELARRLGQNIPAVWYKLLRINLKNMAEGRPFLRTKVKKTSVSRRMPYKLETATVINSQSASFEELEEAVSYVNSNIRKLLNDEVEIRRLAQLRYPRSIKFVRDLLSACEKALKGYIQKRTFFGYEKSYGKLKKGLMAYCAGDKFYVYSDLIDPKSKNYRSTPFLAKLLLHTLLESLFETPDFIDAIETAVFKPVSPPEKEKSSSANLLTSQKLTNVTNPLTPGLERAIKEAWALSSAA